MLQTWKTDLRWFSIIEIFEIMTNKFCDKSSNSIHTKLKAGFELSIFSFSKSVVNDMEIPILTWIFAWNTLLLGYRVNTWGYSS